VVPSAPSTRATCCYDFLPRDNHAILRDPGSADEEVEMGKYLDALEKDLKKLTDQMETISKALKKNPADKAQLAAKAKLAPFLTDASLQKRYEMAVKLDKEETKKLIKECGF
jgi:hypothetical protein